MATLEIAAMGYGIRYDHGLFRQTIKDGWRHEYPEDWLSFDNAWQFPRPEIAYDVGFGGHVETSRLTDGTLAHVWRPGETIVAVAYDTPVVGWKAKQVNTLRLWSARAPEPLARKHGHLCVRGEIPLRAIAPRRRGAAIEPRF